MVEVGVLGAVELKDWGTMLWTGKPGRGLSGHIHSDQHIYSLVLSFFTDLPLSCGLVSTWAISA